MTRQSLKQSLLLQLAVIYTRYLIGGAFVFASLIKIKGHRFTQIPDDGGHSAGHFFEMMYQSGLYWQFLGWAQLLAGLLLLTQRFAMLGAVLFFGIIANVFVITLSYPFAYTPVITGLMLLATLLLLLWDWNRLRVLLNLPVVAEQTSPLYESPLWAGVGAVLFAFTAGYRVLTDRYDFLFWLGGCVGVGAVALLVGLWRQRAGAGLAPPAVERNARAT
ncbi:hypothetical protein ACFST9_22640 [Hymenobacter monticola]|uniref:DoxX family membrane protein n=1 Tax=Hymenobacter monticola TaxID=1705399 RepID=A0ABY4B4N4_9BACT|nr:hypothetical protein [Hymenobacter monticola]UOE34102.1 hypothetical protein MTP16_00270 [Hymenobacter monticola]